MKHFRGSTKNIVTGIVALAICVSWFMILSVTTQVGEPRVEDAIVKFGWPLLSFSGSVDFETFDRAGWFQTICSLNYVHIDWVFFVVNLVVLVTLGTSAVIVSQQAASYFRHVRLQSYFGLIAFIAWYIWMDKGMFDYRDMELEIVLRIYAQRATWIFVLAGCLSLMPMFNMAWHVAKTRNNCSDKKPRIE